MSFPRTLRVSGSRQESFDTLAPPQGSSDESWTSWGKANALGSVFVFRHRGQKVVIPAGVAVFRFGAVKGDRWKITSSLSTRPRSVTVESHCSIPDPFCDDSWIPCVQWGGQGGYWHWAALADVHHMEQGAT